MIFGSHLLELHVLHPNRNVKFEMAWCHNYSARDSPGALPPVTYSYIIISHCRMKIKKTIKVEETKRSNAKVKKAQCLLQT